MQTLILPGFSLKNKDWAEETKRQLDDAGEVEVIYWKHWETGQAEEGWLEKEAERIIGEIGDNKVNILAKSIGTMIAMIILQKKPELINKIILCGIPINDFDPGDENYYEVLKDFSADRIFCIQNKEDNHGSYERVEKLVHSINPAINTVSKERADHEYSYSEDFIKFFTFPEVST